MKSQYAKSQHDKNVLSSCLNSLSGSRFTVDCSIAAARPPRNSCRPAVSVSEGLGKCQRPLAGGAGVNLLCL